MKSTATIFETPHAGPEKTFTNWKPTARFLIDYIFVDCDSGTSISSTANGFAVFHPPRV